MLVNTKSSRYPDTQDSETDLACSLRWLLLVFDKKPRLHGSLDRIGIDTALDQRLSLLFHGAVVH